MGQIRIGEQMRARREQLGLSLRELARRSEGAVGHSTVAQVETGELNATLGTLSAIARLLGMEVDVRLLPAGEGLSPERRAAHSDGCARSHYVTICHDSVW